MTNKLPQTLDFLLDKNWIEDFFNQNVEKIIGRQAEITVKEVKRSKSYAPESFAMYYSVLVNAQETFWRVSASTKQDRFLPFQAMSFVYKNGFNEGDIRTPQPYYFFSKYNFYIYQDVSGHMLTSFLKQKDQELEKKMFKAGEVLKKFHLLPTPDFALSKLQWDFQKEKILEYAPEIKQIFEEPLTKALEKITINGKKLCHGDYQTENLIFGHLTYLIDFGSVVTAHKEADIASFISQLAVMLKRFGDINDFDNLSKSFFDGYGADFENEFFESYCFLYRLQILQALIIMYEVDPTVDKEEIKQTIEFLYNKIKLDNEPRN